MATKQVGSSSVTEKRTVDRMKQKTKQPSTLNYQSSWKQRINDLKEFKKKHGHCDVPFRYQPNPTLGHWVANIRHAKKFDTLAEDKFLILDALGFSWIIKRQGINIPWKQRINDLKLFKKEYGHCNVPQKYQPNPALGHWVAKMRQRKKRGKLAEDIILILDGLGFVWEGLKSGRSDAQIMLLVAKTTKNLEMN